MRKGGRGDGEGGRRTNHIGDPTPSSWTFLQWKLTGGHGAAQTRYTRGLCLNTHCGKGSSRLAFERELNRVLLIRLGAWLCPLHLWLVIATQHWGLHQAQSSAQVQLLLLYRARSAQKCCSLPASREGHDRWCWASLGACTGGRKGLDTPCSWRMGSCRWMHGQVRRRARGKSGRTSDLVSAVSSMFHGHMLPVSVVSRQFCGNVFRS